MRPLCKILHLFLPTGQIRSLGCGVLSRRFGSCACIDSRKPRTIRLRIRWLAFLSGRLRCRASRLTNRSSEPELCSQVGGCRLLRSWFSFLVSVGRYPLRSLTSVVMPLTSILPGSLHFWSLLCMCIGWPALVGDTQGISRSICRIHSARRPSGRSRSSITS
jgi:hypothetical protein